MCLYAVFYRSKFAVCTSLLLFFQKKRNYTMCVFVHVSRSHSLSFLKRSEEKRKENIISPFCHAACVFNSLLWQKRRNKIEWNKIKTVLLIMVSKNSFLYCRWPVTAFFQYICMRILFLSPSICWVLLFSMESATICVFFLCLFVLCGWFDVSLNQKLTLWILNYFFYYREGKIKSFHIIFIALRVLFQDQDIRVDW